MLENNFFVHCILIILFFSACSPDIDEKPTIDYELTELLNREGNGSLDFFKQPSSIDFSNIPQDPKNTITSEKVELGRLLFHEPILATRSKFTSKINTFSCASCHHAQGGFQANMAQGIGDGGLGFGLNGEGRELDEELDPENIDVQPIRTPSILNIAYQTNVLWNGQFGATGLNRHTENNWTAGTPIETNHLGFEGTEIQAIAGLKVHRLELDATDSIFQIPEYKELFDQVFPNETEEDRYSTISAGLAIAAYERTVLANKSPFQEYLNGNLDALTRPQKQGAILFFATNCVHCHTGPSLSSMEFHALGMNELSDLNNVLVQSAPNNAHLGRGGFTQNSEDNYKFKVPQLYNLKDSPFYGHGSSFNTVKDVITYKNQGIKQNQNVPDSHLSEDFKPLEFADYEIDLIVDFIENGLYDPDLYRYVPSDLPSQFCFPNNDTDSQQDLGCN